MPKTLTPVESLQLEIEQIQAAIAATEKGLLEQRQENDEFEQSLKVLSVGAAPFVAQGRLPLMDAVTTLIDESSNESDRQYRWNACQRALDLGQSAAANLESELRQLRQQLAIAESEMDWTANYEPFAERYRDGFSMPSPEAIKEQKVQALRRDIIQRQAHLQRAQAWLNQPEGQRFYYGGDALHELQYLTQVIPALEGQLQRLIAEPVKVDEQYEEKFRKYVVARVSVEETLQIFMAAQREYLIALDALKLAIAADPCVAEFPAVALTEPRIVEATKGIRLAAVNVTLR